MDVNASVLEDLLTGRKAVPYVSLGGGLYRAMFDFGDQRYSGMMGGGTPVDATATGGQMPMFYARRFGAMTAPIGRRGTCRGSPTRRSVSAAVFGST
jgi:hypothetical protein